MQNAKGGIIDSEVGSVVDVIDKRAFIRCRHRSRHGLSMELKMLGNAVERIFLGKQWSTLGF